MVTLLFTLRYSHLEKISRHVDGLHPLLTKLLIDRALFSPPFIIVSLSFLNFFQSLDFRKAASLVRNAYIPTLIANNKANCAFLCYHQLMSNFILGLDGRASCQS